jgi:hypothetical protein
VRREPFRGKARRILLEAEGLIGHPVNTDNQRGGHVRRLQDLAPLREHLPVTGEHDCLGRIRRDVHRDLPTAVVLERLGDELADDRRHRRHGPIR